MIVIQSYCAEGAEGGKSWVHSCLRSVSDWARSQGHAYHIYGDEDVFSSLPSGALEKIGLRWGVLNDYARLAFIKEQLRTHESVLWLDADVFLHKPEAFEIPKDVPFCFGHELWVNEAHEVKGGIHNAFAFFQRENPFLEFYLYACERLLHQFNGAHMAPQFLGPKLLKHYDSLLKVPKTSAITMLSPTVTEALLRGDDEVLTLQADLPQAAGVNLCNSLLGAYPTEKVMRVISLLKEV